MEYALLNSTLSLNPVSSLSAILRKPFVFYEARDFSSSESSS